MIPRVVQLKSVDQRASTKQSSLLLLKRAIVKLKEKLKVIRHCTLKMEIVSINDFQKQILLLHRRVDGCNAAITSVSLLSNALRSLNGEK